MEKAKICIIGDGLSGLTLALVLSKLDLEINVYCRNLQKKKFSDNRVTAISNNSTSFLNQKLNITNKNLFFKCSGINLFYEYKNQYLNFLNFDNKKITPIHIFENKKYKNFLLQKIKKKTNIKLINQSIENIDYNTTKINYGKHKKSYDMIVICAGKYSKINNILQNNRAIKKDYKEIAITGTVKHNLKITKASQHFLKEGPFAILPFKKDGFSFVWTLKNNFFQKNSNIINNILLDKFFKIFKKKINNENLKFQSYPISLSLKKKYSIKNILLFGDAIHSVHPIAGQGFNLTLRDISKLSKLIEKNINLGLKIKDSFILKDFYIYRKPENTLFGLGLGVTNMFFSENKILDPLKNIFLNNIKNYPLIKKISQHISNKGITL